MISQPVADVVDVLDLLDRLPVRSSPLFNVAVTTAVYLVGAPRVDDIVPRLSGGCVAKSTVVPVLVIAANANAWATLAADTEEAINALVAAGYPVTAADPIPFQPPDAVSSLPAYQITVTING